VNWVCYRRHNIPSIIFADATFLFFGDIVFDVLFLIKLCLVFINCRMMFLIAGFALKCYFISFYCPGLNLSLSSIWPRSASWS
jgi:hypothetical protein